jgi:hypothetical protein
VTAQLTDGVEAELQKRMNDLDNRACQSGERLEQLTPHIGRLSEGLARVESYLTEDLNLVLRRTSESVRDGLQHAENLQQLLSILLANAFESNAQLAFAQEQPIQQVSQRANDDLGALMVVVSAAIASSSTLQQQIVIVNNNPAECCQCTNSAQQFSNQQAAVFTQRQNTLEHGMDRLAAATETLSTKLEDHSGMLKQANNITNDILDAQETAAVAPR